MASLEHFDTIPNRTLPPNAFRAIYDGLESRGFKMEENYAFSDRNGKQIETSLLAFTHKTLRSPDYTGLTAFNPANGIADDSLAQALAQSAAPFHIIHRNQTQKFSLWFTNVRNQGRLNVDTRLEAIRVAADIEYSQLEQVIEAYAVDIQPQRITDVKQGRDVFRHFEQEGAFQLALWALDVTGDKLVQHFGQSVELLRKTDVPSSIIPQLSTQLLGATVLAHTGALGQQLRQGQPTLSSLLSVAHQYFPNYFSPQLFDQWHNSAEAAYQVLTELRYANFSPELLTRLYQEAYPDKAQRRELGRYDTPLYLTRRIWEAIPIEYLPPEKRIVADMTCGWGSFLIAGHERLTRMIDMSDRVLREHIYANDSDPFTAQLAGLGLLISTLQDRWHVSAEDALDWRIPDTAPGIIVGNPPFHGSRKAPSEKHNESARRYEEANGFLERAIDILAPSGYLGMIMPQSFVAAQASPHIRKKLLETCDVVELWELPIGVFRDAQANSLAIFAQKKATSGIVHHPVRVRTVQSNRLGAFKEKGPFTASSLVAHQSQWDSSSRPSKNSQITHIYNYSFTFPQYMWEKIRANCVNLSKQVTVFTGIISGSPERRRHIDDVTGSSVQWLTGAHNVIHDSFQITYENPQTLTYPNDFERPRLDKREILSNDKVLFNALSNPSWGKRVKAVIERKGYFVSDNFNVLVPKENTDLTLEALAAVVDWKVSNAWLLDHLKHTKFPMSAIKSIPIPHLSEDECVTLTTAVHEIEQAWEQERTQSASALQTIDNVLRHAYRLDKETYERLTLIAEWDSKEVKTLDAQLDFSARWEISGVVDQVDADKGTITFWLDGFEELQTVAIVPVMPGWLLRPDAAFRTGIPRICVDRRSLSGNTSWGFFHPQDYTYLGEEEAFTKLFEVLS